MADVKISDLASASEPVGTSVLVPVVQGGVTKKATVQALIDAVVAVIVDSAPGTLDTLNELAAALGDDADFAAAVTTALAGKLATTGGTLSGDLVVPDEAYDSTGWDGSLEVPTKNAVRDALVALLAGLPGTYALQSWNVPIDIFSPFSNVTWSHVASLTGGLTLDSGGAQNSEIVFKTFLGAGTWTLNMAHVTQAVNGIYTFSLNGNALTTYGAGSTTIDGYTSGTVLTYSTIPAIVLPDPGLVTVRIVMATKNGSSSGYYPALQRLGFGRTA
jgi:hypothetical protein